MIDEDELRQRIDLLLGGAPVPRPALEQIVRRSRTLRARQYVGGAALAALLVAVLGIPLLWLAPLGSEKDRTPGSRAPVLKANGQIAFLRFDPQSVISDGAVPVGAILTINADGTGLARLVSEIGPGSNPAWSPDGTRLAFSTHVDGVLGTFVINANGEGMTRLTSCDQECAGEGHPTWSPDGTRLAFWRDSDGREGLWVVNSDGTGLTLLREGLSGQPAWSPDGRLIAVNGNPVTRPEDDAIFLVSAESGDVVRSIDAEGLDLRFGVSWSPDGEWLAFDASGRGGGLEGSGVYVVRPDGTDRRLLTSGSCLSHSCRALDPVWSPDGGQIAFTRATNEVGSDGSTGDLFRMEVGTGAVRRITEGPGLDCCPSWQPIPGQ